jgi:cysteine desulfuration protein SufE
MSIEEKKSRMVQKMLRLADRPQDRYGFLMELGKTLPPLAEEDRLDVYLVPGCLSRVWLRAEKSPDGSLLFHSDSDALIPKGMVAFLLEIYNRETPEAILGLSTDFLEEIGLKDQLSYNRRNSLVHFVSRIKLYAQEL